MQIDLTSVFLGILSLIGTIFTTVLVPVLRQRYGTAKLAEAEKWVEVAVAAAEQIAGLTNGKQKKEWVAKFLDSHGVKLSAEEIDALIESAVYNITNFVTIGQGQEVDV
jgi:hypothetical protein